MSDERCADGMIARLLRALVLLCVSLWFLCGVFAVTGDPFWTAGIGDWMDPYFINYLLEHWHHSVRTLSDPASPPMYFPAARTLGYSHGLVLFAPFYLLVRPFLHPFQAYSATLLLVAETGVVCLYLFLRRSFALSFVEALLLTLFFLTSLNVTNGFVGVWSQRASVFLIPPILLLLVTAKRRPTGRLRAAGLFLAGLLSLLMFTQDFYTALLGLYFVLAAFPALAISTPRCADGLRGLWARLPRTARAALVIAVPLFSWALLVAHSGGFTSRIFGVRIASHDWTRPAAVATVLLGCGIWSARKSGWTLPQPRSNSWTLPFGAGAVAGLGVFLWIYAAAYREHPSFPAENLTNSLVAVNGSLSTMARAILETHGGYETLRTFKFVALIALLVWVPVFKADRRTRLLCLYALLLTIVVLLIPLTFNGFSIWRAFFAPLPGFSVIRDPKRIAYLFELAAVVAAGAMMSSLPARSSLRVTIALVLLALLMTERNRTVFDYLRPNATFERWVSAPLSIDPSCRSFYVAPADSAYTQRSNDRWTLYSIDAMFIALNTPVPTLNGYSAWFPPGWNFQDPEDPGYRDAVRRWATMNQLTGVCELDLTKRVMVPAFRN
jgi:hypothetical protein